MDIYRKLALNDEQRKVLDDFEKVYKKMLSCNLYLVETFNGGLFAYNANDVSCFDAPKDAAYDNGKEEIDVTKLHKVDSFGFMAHEHLLNDTKCLVAFE